MGKLRRSGRQHRPGPVFACVQIQFALLHWKGAQKAVFTQAHPLTWVVSQGRARIEQCRERRDDRPLPRSDAGRIDSMATEMRGGGSRTDAGGPCCCCCWPPIAMPPMPGGGAAAEAPPIIAPPPPPPAAVGVYAGATDAAVLVVVGTKERGCCTICCCCCCVCCC